MPRRPGPYPLAAAIGRRIAQLRKERGLTAERLAYESEFGSKGYLSDVENGRALPSLTKLAELAARLDVELLDLLTFPEAGPRHAWIARSRTLSPEELERLLEAVAAKGVQDPVPTAPRTLVPAFARLEVAAGWRPSRRGLEEPPGARVALPVEKLDSAHFAVRAAGTSMHGWRTEIHDGDWLLARAARVGLAAASGRVAIVVRSSPPDEQTLHLKRVKVLAGRVWLASDDPAVKAVAAQPGDRIAGLVERVIRPEALGPPPGTVVADGAVAGAFGLASEPQSPWSRVDGHLFVFAEGPGLAKRRTFPVAVRGRNPAETAFVLTRARTGGAWTYRGVARWAVGRRTWTLG